MIELAGVLRDIAAELEREGVQFAVVGGLAVSIRATPRFTNDADLVVGVTSDSQAERISRQLVGRGYRVLAQLEHRDTRRLATMRLIPPGSHGPQTFIVDLLFAMTGIERDIVAAAESAEVFPGVLLPVALRGHLIAMKVVSASDRRPLDRGDLLSLIRESAGGDMDLARRALAKVTAEGFERGRDLVAELDEHVRIARQPPGDDLSPRTDSPAPPA